MVLKRFDACHDVGKGRRRVKDLHRHALVVGRKLGSHVCGRDKPIAPWHRTIVAMVRRAKYELVMCSHASASSTCPLGAAFGIGIIEEGHFGAPGLLRKTKLSVPAPQLPFPPCPGTCRRYVDAPARHHRRQWRSAPHPHRVRPEPGSWPSGSGSVCRFRSCGS